MVGFLGTARSSDIAEFTDPRSTATGATEDEPGGRDPTGAARRGDAERRSDADRPTGSYPNGSNAPDQPPEPWHRYGDWGRHGAYWGRRGEYWGRHGGKGGRLHRRLRLPVRRSTDTRVVAGVCGGLSRATGIDVTLVRIGFVLLSLGSGVGILVYALIWLLVPLDGETSTIFSRAISDWRGIRLVIAVIPVFVAAQILASAGHIAYLGSISWPLFLAAAAGILIRRNASQEERVWITQDLAPMFTTGAGRRRRWALWLRILAGVLLGLAGLIVIALGPRRTALGPVTGSLMVVAAIVVVFGPWWLSLVRDLMAERQARARAEERAQMASHVHDSVLQTLALIQRSADDPKHVVRLARAQERELRSWLFDGRPPGRVGEEATTLVEGIAALQRQVEADHGITVQIVVVGDCELSDGLRALLEAAREATVNFGQVVGCHGGVRLRRGRAGVGHLLRPRPWLRIRPGSGPRRPPGHRPVDPGPHGPLRGNGNGPVLTRRGDRGGAVHVPPAADGEAHGQGSAFPVTDERLRLFLVDDHAVFRSGVRAELGDAVELVGEADEVDAAVDLINERVPDVVLLDVHLPGGGGQAVLRGVHARHPDIRFLALSVSDAPEDVIAVIRAGARGYITKTISGPELLQAVSRVGAGDAVFSPRLAGFVLDAFASGPGEAAGVEGLDPELDQLSPREREVLRHIARGYTYKEVARDLTISVKTVESHVSSVLRKLQLSTRHELTKWATERRLV